LDEHLLRRKRGRHKQGRKKLLMKNGTAPLSECGPNEARKGRPKPIA